MVASAAGTIEILLLLVLQFAATDPIGYDDIDCSDTVSSLLVTATLFLIPN